LVLTADCSRSCRSGWPRGHLCTTIDGTLAIEFGQKSRVGGILNEVGDIISKIALYLSLMFVSPFSTVGIGLLIVLFVASQLASIVPTTPRGDRRLEGPLGKMDRSIVLSSIAIAIVIFGRLPERASSIIAPVLSVGAIATILNRVCDSLFRMIRNSESIVGAGNMRAATVRFPHKSNGAEAKTYAGRPRHLITIGFAVV
jgi:phosphatidylglycerophosphate synthase